MAPQKKNFAKTRCPANLDFGAADIGGWQDARRAEGVPEKKQRTFDKTVAHCLGKLAKTMKKTHAERAGVSERLRETSF